MSRDIPPGVPSVARHLFAYDSPVDVLKAMTPAELTTWCKERLALAPKRFDRLMTDLRRGPRSHPAGRPSDLRERCKSGHLRVFLYPDGKCRCCVQERAAEQRERTP